MRIFDRLTETEWREVSVAGCPSRIELSVLVWDAVDDLCRLEGMTVDDWMTHVCRLSCGRQLDEAVMLQLTLYFRDLTRRQEKIVALRPVHLDT